MSNKMLIIKRLFIVGLLLAVVDASGFARSSGLLSSARQAIKQHGARGVATAGALLMLCAGGCEQMQNIHFVGSDNPANISSGSIDEFRSAGETGSYVGGNSVELTTRTPGNDEALRVDRLSGVTASLHERETLGDLAINIVDSDTGVFSDSYYLSLVEDNGSYTIYDRLGPGRTRIGDARRESNYLRLSFAGNFSDGVVAYLYDPVLEQADDRVGRQFKLEYLNRPWGYAGRADLELNSQMYWNSEQTAIIESQPTTVGLRSIGEMYRESYPNKHSNRVLFSADNGEVQLANRDAPGPDGSETVFLVLRNLRMTADEYYRPNGEIYRLAVWLNREQGEQMHLDLQLARSKDLSGGGYEFDVSDSDGHESLGGGELLADGTIYLMAFYGELNMRVELHFSEPRLSDNGVWRVATIRITHGDRFSGEQSSVFGQPPASLFDFSATLTWDAGSSARLSE